MQSGTIGEPFKSLTDIDAMLEYARQFPDKIRASGGSNIHSVIYQKYTNSVSFGIALDLAKKERFADFDDSLQIMKELISLYDLANARVELASDALSKPEEFENVNKESVASFLKAVVSTRDKLAVLARSCATASKEGKSCAPTKDTDLIIPTVTNLKRSVPCNLTTFAASNGSAAATCSQVRKINGRCLCIECQLFVSPPYSVQDSQSLSDRCFKMPAGAAISLTAKFNLITLMCPPSLGRLR